MFKVGSVEFVLRGAFYNNLSSSDKRVSARDVGIYLIHRERLRPLHYNMTEEREYSEYAHISHFIKTILGHTEAIEPSPEVISYLNEEMLRYKRRRRIKDQLVVVQQELQKRIDESGTV